MPTHAEAIAATLAAHGVEYLFGLPGGEIVVFLDACRRAGIRFILTGHEASAAWMAQTVGQITGIPGVCAATLGPGATNLVTGVANAFLDRAPLLAITAQIPASAIATMTHQRLPLNEIFSPITKRSITLDGGDTGATVLSALRLAAAPRPGPVHIALPSDIASGAGPRPASAAGSSGPCPTPDLDEIEARIHAARRPMVIVGLGSTPSCAPAVRTFVAKLQAPFLVTPKAKGILPEDDALFSGVASGMAIDRDILETIRTADLIVGIGFDPVECDKNWFSTVPIVSIDTAAMAAGDYRPAEAIGDIETVLSSISATLAPKPWPAGMLAERRQAITRIPVESANGFSPLRVIELLRAAFPREGIVTCDVGSHKLLMGQFWRSYEPGTFFVSNGLSGMGYGLPAAIAAQLVHHGRPVMSVVGDGGMLMMLHDLALIRELALPIVIVVFRDGSLSLIRVSEERRGLQPYGVDFSPPDFPAIARAFGIRGARAASIQQIPAAVEAALSDRNALLLEVPIDYREYYELV